MNTIFDVIDELEKLSSQYVDKSDNIFRQMADVLIETRLTIDAIDEVLTVPAAEYVPAIRDAFVLLDKLRGIKRNPRHPTSTQ